MPSDNSGLTTIFLNGKVAALGPGDRIHQGLAVQGRQVLAIGSDSEMRALQRPDTEVIDLQGRVVIPGIIDIHAHMDREALKRAGVSLEGARSIPDILAVVKREVDKARPGEWVVTMPIGDPPNYADTPASLAEGRFPTRWDLDQVSPDNPVYIRGIWTPWNVPPSVAVANSRALELAEIDRHTREPDSSVTIVRDDAGEPTGVLMDSGQFPSLEFTLMKVVPRFTEQQRVNALRESMRLYNSVGTTGTYEGHGVAPEVLRAYKRLWDDGDMTVRCRLVLSPAWKSVDEAALEMERWGYSASGAGFGDDMLNISGYYIQHRGGQYTAEARAAELPFTGWAGFSPGHNPPAQFRTLSMMAAHHNLRVNTIVRDYLDEVLDIFEEVHRETPIDQRRWIIAHVRETTTEQMRRICDLGLVIETIPLTELWLRGGPLVEDPETATLVVPHRSYFRNEVRFGLGTDNKPFNPFVTLWSTIARKERRSGAVLGPEESLSRMDALRAFTLGGAYYSFEEDRRGSLEPGKLADLAVLSDDLFTIPEDDIPGLHSVLTMTDGQVVHRSEEF